MIYKKWHNTNISARENVMQLLRLSTRGYMQHILKYI